MLSNHPVVAAQGFVVVHRVVVAVAASREELLLWRRFKRHGEGPRGVLYREDHLIVSVAIQIERLAVDGHDHVPRPGQRPAKVVIGAHEGSVRVVVLEVEPERLFLERHVVRTLYLCRRRRSRRRA